MVKLSLLACVSGETKENPIRAILNRLGLFFLMFMGFNQTPSLVAHTKIELILMAHIITLLTTRIKEKQLHILPLTV